MAHIPLLHRSDEKRTVTELVLCPKMKGNSEHRLDLSGHRLDLSEHRLHLSPLHIQQVSSLVFMEQGLSLSLLPACLPAYGSPTPT